MSSSPSPWPWMEGHSTVIADPIPPIFPGDDRPSVKDLIKEHRSSIDALKKEVQNEPHFDAKKHDDLWLLRFLLSHKKVKPAIKAAKFTLDFRHKHKLDDKDIRSLPLDKNCDNESVRLYMKYCDDDTFPAAMPHMQGTVIGFIKMRGIRQHDLVANVDEKHWLPLFTYISEWTFQWIDHVTRTTGRLTKSIRIADATGINLSMLNLESKKRDGKAMSTLEDCYPQMLQSIFIVNPPSWIQVAWRLIKPIMPKRVTEKLEIFTPEREKNKTMEELDQEQEGKDGKKDSNKAETSKKMVKKKGFGKKKQKVNQLFRYISAEDLPIHLGGENKGWPSPPQVA